MDIPGLPTIRGGIATDADWEQAREAFLAWATRNTGGLVANAAEYNEIMRQVELWIKSQLAGNMLSGADLYERSLAEPHLSVQLAADSAVPPGIGGLTGGGLRFITGQDIIAAYEAGNPITWDVINGGGQANPLVEEARDSYTGPVEASPVAAVTHLETPADRCAARGCEVDNLLEETELPYLDDPGALPPIFPEVGVHDQILFLHDPQPENLVLLDDPQLGSGVDVSASFSYWTVLTLIILAIAAAWWWFGR